MRSMTPFIEPLRERGFLFAPAEVMRPLLIERGMEEWDRFAASWDDLGLDTYMADGGRYRKRRHAVFRARPGAIERKPDQPHYQSRDYNALNGGIARWFAPMLPEIVHGAAFRVILASATELFSALCPDLVWHVEAHQFRIEARPGQSGQPTPEGMHQDGVDWVMVLLVSRENVASGVTGIHGLDRQPLDSFTLERPFDTALVDDHRVFHGVTPVEPIDPSRSAHRDVLVLTFRRE